MAAPGWYPDPESLSRERFWDGDAWTVRIRETGTQVRPAPAVDPDQPGGSAGDERFQPFQPSLPLPDLDAPTVLGRPGGTPDTPPGQAPVSASAPPPSDGAAGGGWVAGPGPGGGAAHLGYVSPLVPPEPRRRTGLVVGIAALAVAVVAGVVVFLVLPGGDDEVTDPGPTASPTARVTPSVDLCNAGDSFVEEGAPVEGRVQGGGIGFDLLEGYRYDEDLSFGYQFATDIEVVAPRSGKKESTYAAAALERVAAGDPATAAAAVLDCIATSTLFYSDVTVSYAPGEMQETEVDGRPAVSMTGTMTFTDGPIEGTDVQVVVVDTDDPTTYGLFVGSQELGDDGLLEERAEVVESLTVG